MLHYKNINIANEIVSIDRISAVKQVTINRTTLTMETTPVNIREKTKKY